MNDFRDADVRYIAKLLGIDFTKIDLNNYREKRKIYRDHQNMILKAMNFRPFDKKAKIWLQSQLENLVIKQM